MVRFHKPGNDLNYFFFTSCTDDCRNEYRDDLLKLYISTLRETLIKFNYSGFIPNFDDLNTSLYECRNIGMNYY